MRCCAPEKLRKLPRTITLVLDKSAEGVVYYMPSRGVDFESDPDDFAIGVRISLSNLCLLSP